MSTLQLTPAQHAILAYAIEHTAGKVEWFPDNVRGGARTKVTLALERAGLVRWDTHYFVVTEAGFAALGRAQPAPPAIDASPANEAAVAPTVATAAPVDEAPALAPAPQPQVEAKPRTREHSKQATVIAMLRRPEGATIAQICETTGWQRHTVRGTFAGALKKKLGLIVMSDKPEGGERVYQIA